MHVCVNAKGETCDYHFTPNLQLRVRERTVFVKILLKSDGKEALDLTEQVYTAGEGASSLLKTLLHMHTHNVQRWGEGR